MDIRVGKPDRVPVLLWSLGDVFLPANTRQVLDAPFARLGSDLNGWTIIHGVSGFIIASTGIDLVRAHMIHFGWELFQIAIGMTKREEAWDIVWDTLAFHLGFSAV